MFCCSLDILETIVQYLEDGNSQCTVDVPRLCNVYHVCTRLSGSLFLDLVVLRLNRVMDSLWCLAWVLADMIGS